MKVWSFVSQKGGAGKSTLATQMGVLAQSRGERVSIVDLDQQGSAAAWGKVRGSALPESFKAAPSDLTKIVKSGKDYGYTLLMIDTASKAAADAVDAVKLADLIVCPTKTSLFDLDAMRGTVEILNLCNRRQLAFAVVNEIPPPKKGRLASEYEEAVTFLKQLDLRVCVSAISDRKAFDHAMAKGKGVTELTGREFKDAAKEIVSLYDELLLLTPSNVVQLKGMA